MKKYILIALLFICYGSFGQAVQKRAGFYPNGQLGKIYNDTIYSLSNTPLKYWNGYGNFVSLYDTVRAGLSLTTTGSGAATYNSVTGVFNVPTIVPGAGTVTSFSKTDNYGITSSVTNSTTTPNHAIAVDSATLSTKYLRIVDTAGIRFRPIAGTNITLSGTYPNITFNASGGGGTDSAIWKNDGTYTGNRVLTMGAKSQSFIGGKLLPDSVRIGNARIYTNTQGLNINFSDSITGTTTTNANIDITNASTGGGAPVQDVMSGAGNIKIIASSANKIKAAGFNATISGNNNTFINGHTTSAVSGNDNICIGCYAWLGTSGSTGIYMGPASGRGVTTGGTNIHITYANNGNSTATAGLSNTVLLGDYGTYNAYVSNDASINVGTFLSTHLYVGPKGGLGSAHMLEFGGRETGTDLDGKDGAIIGGRGVGAARSGALKFQTYGLLGTGSTYQSTLNTKLFIDFLGTAVSSTSATAHASDAALDVQSTTQGFILPRMTSAQRDLMANGVLTIVFSGGGSGYTNGNVPLTITGGAGTGAAGYAIIAGGNVSSAVLTVRGSGYTSAPTVTVTSGAGTGATFTATIGATAGNTIYCSDCTATDASTGVVQTSNGTAWKNHW